MIAPLREPLRLVDVACPLCDSTSRTDVARGKDFEYDTCDETFTVVRCSDCGVTYLCPRPDVSELSRIYPPEYAPYHFDERSLTLRVRGWLEGRRVRALRRMIPEMANVLDGGCGGPCFLESLRRYGGANWTLYGNDIAPQVLDELERRGLGALGGRFEEIDAGDTRFDAIFLKQVIEHLDKPRAVVHRAAELLRPGGLLVIETPNVDAWDARLFGGGYWGGYHLPRHWTLFSPTTLERLGREAGLEVASLKFMFSPSFWVQAVHHLLKDRGWPRWIYGAFTHLNPVAVGVAVAVDALQRLSCGRTSNMQMVLRKPESAR